MVLPYIPQNPDQMQAVFQQLERQWDWMDILVHCLACQQSGLQWSRRTCNPVHR